MKLSTGQHADSQAANAEQLSSIWVDIRDSASAKLTQSAFPANVERSRVVEYFFVLLNQINNKD